MSHTTRAYAGRLSGLQVRGPDFEVIGRVRDVVVTVRPLPTPSRALGLVVELSNSRRIFVPMLRIAAIEPGDVTLATGSVSLRAFQPRAGEATVLGDLVSAKVYTDDPELPELHGKAVEIASSGTHHVILLEDGRVQAFGLNDAGQLNVNDWQL